MASYWNVSVVLNGQWIMPSRESHALLSNFLLEFRIIFLRIISESKQMQSDSYRKTERLKYSPRNRRTVHVVNKDGGRPHVFRQEWLRCSLWDPRIGRYQAANSWMNIYNNIQVSRLLLKLKHFSHELQVRTRYHPPGTSILDRRSICSYPKLFIS